MAGPQYVSVIAPDGQRIEVPEAGLQQAIDAGARIETPQEVQARLDKAEYGEGLANELKAGVAGAARGATLGLSDVLAADLGHGETVQKLREQNPTASTAGEIAGATVPALLSGGESAVASGARAVSAPVRAVTAAGEAVGGATARALEGLAAKGLAGRTAAALASRAAAGVVEGGIFGAGMAVSEAVLEDHELTAEQVLQSVGAAALLGGAVGGGIGAAGELGAAGAQAAKRGVQQATSRVRELFGRVSKGGPGVQREISELAQISSTLTGTSKAEIEFFANPANKAELDAALAGDEAIMAGARRVAKEENELDDIFEKVTDQGRGKAKLEGLKAKLDDGNAHETFSASANLVEDIKGRLDDLEARAKDASEFEIGPVRKMQAALKKTLAGMEDPGAEHVNARLFFDLDNFKRDAQKVVNKAAKAARTSNAARDTFEALNDVQESLRSHLEDRTLWGAAADAQADVNRPWTRFLQNERYEGADFHVRRSGNAHFEDLYENDPAKWMGFMKRLGTPAGDIDTKYLAERVAARQQLVEAMERQFGNSPETAALVARFKELSGSSAKTMLDMQRVSTLQNRFKALEGDGTISGVAAGALAGWSAGGLRGAVKGGIFAKALSSPQQSLRQMAAAQGFKQRIGTLQTVANAAKAAGDRVSKAVDGMLGKAKSAGRAASRFAPLAATIIDKPGTTYLRAQRKDEDPQVLYASRIAELRTLVQTPTVAAERLAHGTERLALSKPQASVALQAKAMQVASFLLSKAPAVTRTQTDIMRGTTRPVAKTDLATFERYVRAATEPSSALEELASGHISIEAAETMRTLYPKTVEQLRAKVVDAFAKGAQLSHHQEMLLSRFFDTPFSSTLEPSFVAQMQQNWLDGSAKAAAQPAQSPQPGVRQTGLAKSEIGEHSLTKSQALMAG